jgi:hypothetical protein
MWPLIRGLFRQFMDHGRDVSYLVDYLAKRGLQLDELPSVIRSLFDPPEPLSELQTSKPWAGFGQGKPIDSLCW